MRKIKCAFALLGLMAATPASADIVADWSELLTSVDKAAAPADYMFDPQTLQAGSKAALAVFDILAAEGKPPPGGLHFTTEKMPGVFITVPDWPAYAKAVDQSRIDAGVHFRFTAEASDPMGARLGQMAMERLKPLK